MNFDIPFTPDEAAMYMGMKPKTLADWRSEGKGPRFLKIGGRIKYRRQDLDDYMEARVCKSTAQARLTSA